MAVDRWGVIPLVSGEEMLRGEGLNRHEEPFTIEYRLAHDEHGRPLGWTVDLQRTGKDPILSTGQSLGYVLEMLAEERWQSWAIAQQIGEIDKLAGEIRDSLTGGLYTAAARSMKLFTGLLYDVEHLDEPWDAMAAQALDREPRTVPLDDLSHSVVCLAQVETVDGLVLVEGVAPDAAEEGPLVELRDDKTHPDPFKIRCSTPEQADALWAAVHGARVAVWGEPTPFTSRS